MKHVYLLGAGFTKAICGEKAFLADELLKHLDVSQYPEIHDLFENSGNIEEFFTKIDLRYIVYRERNDSLSKRYEAIRNGIKKQVSGLFSEDKLDIEKNYINKKLGLSFVGKIPQDATIITLNYDCLMDQLLWHERLWEPFRGYYYPRSPDVFHAEADYRQRLGKEYEKIRKMNIHLLKVHGSLNFKFYDRKDYVDVEVKEKVFHGMKVNLGIMEDENRGPNVLLLSYIKEINVDLFRTWQKAMHDLANAEKLTIIGCSLRNEDRMLRYALSHFGRCFECDTIEKEAEKFKNKHVEIIDVSESAADNIKHLIQHERLFLYPIDDNRIKSYPSLEGYVNQI